MYVDRYIHTKMSNYWKYYYTKQCSQGTDKSSIKMATLSMCINSLFIHNIYVHTVYSIIYFYNSTMKHASILSLIKFIYMYLVNINYPILKI